MCGKNEMFVMIDISFGDASPADLSFSFGGKSTELFL